MTILIRVKFNEVVSMSHDCGEVREYCVSDFGKRRDASSGNEYFLLRLVDGAVVMIEQIYVDSVRVYVL